MSKVVLGVDIETSGVDPEKDFITEIGYVLHDFDTKRDILKGNILLKAPEGAKKIPEEVVKLTGITDDMLKNYGIMHWDAFGELETLVLYADYVAAHNASFEKDFLSHKVDAIQSANWIDTRVDINYPSKLKTRKLTYLAAEHGIFVRRAHRALDDVDTMIQLMGEYDFEEIVKFSKSPMMHIQAGVSFAQKDLAKEAGFYFDPKTRSWLMDIKEISFVALRDSVKFNILIMG